MTREEQLDWLYRLKSEIFVYMPKEWLIPMNNALDMTIKALEQEPCEDCVSRRATLNAIIKELCIKDESYLLQSEKAIYNVVKNMPPVTPQEPCEEREKGECPYYAG